METLGYMDARIFSKIDLVRIKLNAAIKLFIEEEFICSLTLAGAAEEIFSGLMRYQGKTLAIELACSSIDITKKNTLM